MNENESEDMRDGGKSWVINYASTSKNLLRSYVSCRFLLTCHQAVDNVSRLVRPGHIVQGLGNVKEHHVNSEQIELHI